MKLVYEFITIIAFFAAYKFYNIYVATAVLMLLLISKSIYTYTRYKKIDKVELVVLAIVLLSGGLTLVLKNPDFIKYKPTVVNLFFAVTLLIGYYVFNKNLFQAMIGKQLELPSRIWSKLLHIWVVFFIFMALLNAYIATYFSEAFWVNFKIWGFIFPLIAGAISGIVIYQHLKKDN